MGTSITALIPQGFLVNPGEIPVPRKEVTSVVYSLGLVDVRSHPVIEASLRTRRLGAGSFGRLGLDALDGIDISLLLVLGEGTPLAEIRVSMCPASIDI